MAHGQGLGQAGQPSMNTHKTLQVGGASIGGWGSLWCEKVN